MAGRVSQKNGDGFFFFPRLRRVLFWESSRSLETRSATSVSTLWKDVPLNPRFTTDRLTQRVFFFYYPAEVILVCVAHYQRVLGS